MVEAVKTLVEQAPKNKDLVLLDKCLPYTIYEASNFNQKACRPRCMRACVHGLRHVPPPAALQTAEPSPGRLSPLLPAASAELSPPAGRACCPSSVNQQDLDLHFPAFC
jgi:hypothetical protein